MRPIERKYNTKPNSTSFKKGHKKIGGFIEGSKHTKESKRKVTQSLIGKFAEKSRRWKGLNASYTAKHKWILKHFGKANHCSLNPLHKAKRFEWANISGKYLREISDYIPVCPSCHQGILHRKEKCKNGHELIDENIYISPKSWRGCRICRKEAMKKYVQNH